MIIDLFSDVKRPYIKDDRTACILRRIRDEFEIEKNHFDNVTDPSLTETAIYRMKSLEAAYASVIKKAKLDKLYCDSVFGLEKL